MPRSRLGNPSSRCKTFRLQCCSRVRRESFLDIKRILSSAALARETLTRQLALNTVSRFGEVDFFALDGRARSVVDVDIGHKNRGKVVEGSTSGRLCRQITRVFTSLAAMDGDLSAVHVHLTVANLVEPSPHQQCLSGRGISGDLEVVRLLQRTAAKHRMNNMEALALVVRQRNLTRTSTVGGAAGNGQFICFSSSVIRNGLEGVISIALTRKIRAARR